MTRRIAILPDAVADQIAAGEVVERPASVVKELVENAIDAGATHIRVTVEEGGKSLIEVGDDGSGMGREDAVLAIERHATSKIRAAGDLVGVATFGFRGEALPAIASVSRLALVTSEGEPGTALAVTGGRLEQVEGAARQRGTTVTVRGLFFNTPARRKFLRSVASEGRAVVETVSTLALAHPDVGFELVVDGVPRLHAPASQTPGDRLVTVWGRDLAGTLLPVAHAVGAFRVEGWIQRPADARPTGRRVQLFVNGRPFRDPFLVRAAEAGYRSAIAPGDRPSLLLRIETAPDQVDVNVHPAKLEVRFRDRAGLERVIEEAARLALGELAAAASLGDWRPLPGPRVVPEGEAWLAAPAAAVADLFTGGEAAPLPEAPSAAATFAVPLLQAFATYIVYEAPEGLVIVDQHSAHERVLYETLRAQLDGAGAPSQRLLVPLTLELTDEELEVLERHGELLARAGFDAEPFGGRTAIVRAAPLPHPRFDAARCFREVVADLAGGRFAGWASPLDRFAMTWACRAAVKAGDRLSDAEMRELLLRLFATELPPHDVHGRATIVQLPRAELERRFGRR
ncbi:MAG TPA: DNA mismatch repair endonuclease MutL [Gemmatimonadales bacterium]|nr:DNA mismatch repair endonuclease MutL [Gemmatimonadales bacterium]